MPVDHRTRTDYPRLVAVVDDASRLVADLRATTEGKLMVTLDEVDFITARLADMLALVRVEASHADREAAR